MHLEAVVLLVVGLVLLVAGLVLLVVSLVLLVTGLVPLVVGVVLLVAGLVLPVAGLVLLVALCKSKQTAACPLYVWLLVFLGCSSTYILGPVSTTKNEQKTGRTNVADIALP